MKVYNKKGNTNYKEKRLVKQLREALSEQGIEDFEPAGSFEELQAAHEKYFVEDAKVEINPTNIETENINMPDEPITNTDGEVIAEAPTPAPELKSNANSSDPLNRSEPIIRNYVMDDYNNQSPEGETKALDFAEPVDFKDAFEIPSETEDGEQTAEKSEPKTESSGPAPADNYVNPNFSEMDSKKAKKKAVRFAKQITGLVCDLAEKGFVYATTKDITEAKLAEYEASGEMDLSFLVQLADGQEVAIKQFFANQRMLSEAEGKIGEEEREELTDALAEVFLEKGIAPTPTQELAITSAKVFGVMLIKGITIQKQNQQILNQLREVAPAQEESPVEPAPAPDEEVLDEEITEDEAEILEEEAPTEERKSRRSSSPSDVTWNDLENLETYT